MCIRDREGGMKQERDEHFTLSAMVLVFIYLACVEVETLVYPRHLFSAKTFRDSWKILYCLSSLYVKREMRSA